MTTKTFCDLCNKELKEQSDCYYFKLYKLIISSEFWTTKQICKMIVKIKGNLKEEKTRIV